ncbi:MAG: YoaP domain-containing protein [Clostridia bacterium]|nr:YoaP domain-containing protein [Clostridia bacterium]
MKNFNEFWRIVMEYIKVTKENLGKEHNIPFKAIRIESKYEAQNSPTPITTYALFYNGEYLTNEQMNDTKFLKFVSKRR